MARALLGALAGLAIGMLAATDATAGNAYRVVYHAHPYHALYPADVAPYLGTARKPMVLGRHAPRIAMWPARFHAYPYVSGFDSCVRWRRVGTRYGWRWHRTWACG
jgi:hypothetical protein